MQKPLWAFRPEPWLEQLIEKEIEANPQIKGKTAAIHALIQKAADLEAKLKVAEADAETWKKYGEEKDKVARDRGWIQGKAPPRAPTE